MITALALTLIIFHTKTKVSRPSIKALSQDVSKLVIPETAAHKAARMRWWKNARFGLFIHWGIYSIPAGTWTDENGKTSTDNAEWIRESAQIPIQTYDKFAKQFDPVQFNADKWVKAAHNAGMKYLVITSKHHDGFNMFASKYTKFNIMNTPWHHDPLPDLAAACKKYGLKFGLYHSIMDWNDYNYLPRRSWEVANRPVGDADFSKYVAYLRHDITQLLTSYGPISVLWFDGEWENTWNDTLGAKLYNLCRTLQPNIIVNNRVAHTRSDELGDYSTPEQTIPATGLPGRYWETCMTMNDHWGYNKRDHNYKSVKTIVRNLVDIVSKGGNYLLNIGPTSQGTFPSEALDRLQGIGKWMHVNSQSIYDTDASVFSNLPWGRCTIRKHAAKTQLYLSVFDWPAGGNLVVPGIANSPIKAHILGLNARLNIQRQGADLVIAVPNSVPNPICTVVELDVAGAPKVYDAPVINASGHQFIESAHVSVKRSGNTIARYTVDGTMPTTNSPEVNGNLALAEPSDFDLTVGGFRNNRLVTSLSKYHFTIANPIPAQSFSSSHQGIAVEELAGDFSSVNDISKGQEVSSTISDQIGLPKSWGTKPKEHVGLQFDGEIQVDKTAVYNFRLTSDDGSCLWIDRPKVVDNDGLHTTTSAVGQIALAKGQHPISLRYFNATGGASLKLEWSVDDKPFTVVPADHLYWVPLD